MGPIDAQRLLTSSDETLHRLRDRLRAIGFDGGFSARLARMGGRLDDALRTPVRIWHARRMSEPAAVAARLFLLHDAVELGEVERALGDLPPLVACGLLEEGDGGLISRAHMGFAGEACILGDPPGVGADAVPPVGGGTLALLAAVSSDKRVANALDLGCGAGGIALNLARTADRVVATDVSSRALAFARLAARFNGVRNVEFREGDLFYPMRGERFDLVASQPPFLARRGDTPWSAHIHGGRRGDELAMRAVAGVGHHTATDGRAVLLADLPVVEGESIERALKEAVGAQAVDLVALQSPAKDLDEYCTYYAAAEHPLLDRPFAEAVMGQREHLEVLGVRGVALTILVAEPTSRVPFCAVLPVRHPNDVVVTAGTLDRILASHRLARGESDELLAARLRVAPGARIVDQPLREGSPGSGVIIHPPPGHPEWPQAFEATTAVLLGRISRAPSPQQAAADLSREEGIPLERARTLVQSAAREGLLRGALVGS